MRHHRLDVRVDHGGAGALELLDLRQHLRGDGEVHRRRPGPDVLGDAVLVLGIHVRVQKTDGDGVDLGGEQPRRGLLDAREVQGSDHPPLEIDALDHLAAQMPRHQGGRFFPLHVVEAWIAQPADLEHVPKSLGGDEPHPGSGAGDYRIGGDGGCVHQVPDVARIHIAGAHHGLEAGADGVAVIVAGRQNLVDGHPASRINGGDVGEGSSHVESNTLHASLLDWTRTNGAGRRRSAAYYMGWRIADSTVA